MSGYFTLTRMSSLPPKWSATSRSRWTHWSHMERLQNLLGPASHSWRCSPSCLLPGPHVHGGPDPSAPHTYPNTSARAQVSMCEGVVAALVEWSQRSVRGKSYLMCRVPPVTRAILPCSAHLTGTPIVCLSISAAAICMLLPDQSGYWPFHACSDRKSVV